MSCGGKRTFWGNLRHTPCRGVFGPGTTALLLGPPLAFGCRAMLFGTCPGNNRGGTHPGSPWGLLRIFIKKCVLRRTRCQERPFLIWADIVPNGSPRYYIVPLGSFWSPWGIAGHPMPQIGTFGILTILPSTDAIFLRAMCSASADRNDRSALHRAPSPHPAHRR